MFLNIVFYFPVICVRSRNRIYHIPIPKRFFNFQNTVLIYCSVFSGILLENSHPVCPFDWLLYSKAVIVACRCYIYENLGNFVGWLNEIFPLWYCRTNFVKVEECFWLQWCAKSVEWIFDLISNWLFLRGTQSILKKNEFNNIFIYRVSHYLAL